MTAASPPPRIGWVGTGRMGAAMAHRLLDAGRDVAVWNRTRSKTEPLAEAGAAVVDHPSDLADRDVVFTMVGSSDDLLAVLTGPDGLLATGSGPGVVVDASTVASEASAKARQTLGAAGSAYLAAPVSGNPKVIRAGKMIFAVSGPADVFDRVQPVLEDIASSAVHVGEGELARFVKLCHNLYLGSVIQSLVEVTTLAERGGVSREAFLRFLNDSPMGSLFSRYKSPALVNLDFTPTFTLPLLRKDLDLGIAEGGTLGVPLRLAERTRDIVQEALDEGFTEEDFAKLLVLQAKLAGMELASEHAEVDDGLHDAEPE